ncbi:MAG: FkbM family methyltransferase [Actinobacteria bacterium]|nr:FkbM family methyltransferase [Actinomycetota bacterium]
MKKSEILEALFCVLPTVSAYHSPNTFLYNLLKKIARREIEDLFQERNGHSIEFNPFGELNFPYHSMGTIDSLNLFDLDELIILSFYWQNKTRYKKALDIGANLGLHSIILSKCGYSVSCYEPDPVHFKILKENLALNNVSNVQCYNMAVSNESGKMEFVRVLDNTTGSHLVGSKPNPYGELEKISVETRSFNSILSDFDLVKIDVEGHEKALVCSTDKDDWENIDGVLSIHDETNALALYKHFKNLGIKLFSQKINWHIVSKLGDIPLNHYEGSLFVTTKNKMFWE